MQPNDYAMKRIYVILFAAALSASFFSCEEKTSSDKANGHDSEEGVKDTAMLKEMHKTTENGGDAH